MKGKILKVFLAYFLFFLSMAPTAYAEFYDSFHLSLDMKEKRISIRVVNVPYEEYKEGHELIKGFGIQTFTFNPPLSSDETLTKTFRWKSDTGENTFRIEIESRSPLRRGYAGFQRRSYASIWINENLVFNSPIGGVFHLQVGDMTIHEVDISRDLHLSMEAEFYRFGWDKTMYFKLNENRYSLSEDFSHSKPISFLNLLANYPDEQLLLSHTIDRIVQARYIKPEFPKKEFEYFNLPTTYDSPEHIKKLIQRFFLKNGPRSEAESHKSAIEHYLSFEENPMDKIANYFTLASEEQTSKIVPITFHSCKGLFKTIKPLKN